jgi:hypothetical protein
LFKVWHIGLRSSSPEASLARDDSQVLAQVSGYLPHLGHFRSCG